MVKSTKEVKKRNIEIHKGMVKCFRDLLLVISEMVFSCKIQFEIPHKREDKREDKPEDNNVSKELSVLEIKEPIAGIPLEYFRFLASKLWEMIINQAGDKVDPSEFKKMSIFMADNITVGDFYCYKLKVMEFL